MPPKTQACSHQATDCNHTLGRGYVSLASENWSSDSRGHVYVLPPHPAHSIVPQAPLPQNPGAWRPARPALSPPPRSAMAGAYAETTFPFRIPAGAMALTSLPPTMNTSKKNKNQVPGPSARARPGQHNPRAQSSLPGKCSHCACASLPAAKVRRRPGRTSGLADSPGPGESAGAGGPRQHEDGRQGLAGGCDWLWKEPVQSPPLSGRELPASLSANQRSCLGGVAVGAGSGRSPGWNGPV